MNTDFAKLLNNCLNRIDGKDDDTKTEDVDNVAGTENNVESSSSNSSSIHYVRPEIKDIIDDKIKAEDETEVSPTIGLVNPIKNRLKASIVDPHEKSDTEPEKAKILFSLKDFFERSKDNEPKENRSSAPEKDKLSDDENSNLYKNVDVLYNNQDNQADESDKESDDSESDLEVVKSENSEQNAEDSKSNKVSDDSDVEDAKEDPDQDSDLESELNILEKLKQKLDDSIDSSTKIHEKNDEDTDTSIKKNENEATENVKGDQETASGKTKETNESSTAADESDPIVLDDLRPKETNDITSSKLKEARGIFKNISISVVGGNSKNINLECFLTPKPPPAAPKLTPIFPTGPNISIKRKSGSSPTNVFDSKRTKKSPILLSSDEEKSPKKKSVPTLTLDEHSTLENVSEDEEDTDGNDDLILDYDNCTHGDPMDYMCVDCTYNRWRCQWKQARPKKVKVKTGTDISNPAEIIQAVNWEKVFKFAGVTVGEEEVM